MRLTIPAGIMALVLGPMTANATAILIDCSATSLSHIQYVAGSAANGCQYLEPPDSANFATLANINSAGGTGFFGFSDWEVAVAKQDLPDGAVASGSWSIQSHDPTATNMIVFKDGLLTNLIGFTLVSDASSGTWTSPFMDPPFDLCGPTVTDCTLIRDVSHFAIFKRAGDDPPNDVPEPGTLALFGIGLAGTVLARRRRKS